VAGTDNIFAVYSGDTNYSGSPSAAVTVTVSGAGMVTVPNVVGLTQAAATTAITTAGLTVGTVTTASSATVAAGSVISENPAAGSSAAASSAVSLVVSTGPAMTPGVTLLPGMASLSFAPGATTGNSTTIAVTPAGGFTGSVTLTAAVTQSPSGASDLPVPSFGATSPVTITGTSAGSGTLTVATTAAGSGAAVVPARPGVEYVPVAVAGLLLLVIPRKRRGLQGLLLIACAAVLGGMMGCGGGHGGGMVSSNPGTTAGNYTITVTATAGSVMATTTVGVVVQ
jgi:trimeric autotransporter adhesin